MDIVGIESPQKALDLLQAHLVESGAEGELAFGLLNRLRDEPDTWGPTLTLLAGYEHDKPVAFVLRTSDRYPALIVGFVDASGIDFAAFVREMQRIDHAPTSVNGAVRCCVPFAQAWERETGATLRTLREHRAFELRQLRPPQAGEGNARVATSDDVGFLESWCTQFVLDIGDETDPDEAAETAARLVSGEDLMLWETLDGPVSMAAINRRTPSSSCVAWVYTPPAHRRHGYAGAVVAALSQRELDAGAAWCSLFTDVANPTSNHIYAELGYEPRCDFRHIELAWSDETTCAERRAANC